MAEIIDRLFGIPFYKDSIDSSFYEKEKIIKQIERNFYKDKNRNCWDSNSKFLSSDLHHVYNDYDNEKFEKVDFSSLISVYDEKISSFMRSVKFKEKTSYSYGIVNYTCMEETQYMNPHNHPIDFFAVHYLSFDEESHPSTVYYNGNNYSSYINDVIPSVHKKLDNSYFENSWVCDNYFIKTTEDDFIITPGILKHGVPPFKKSDKLRMTIVINIKLE